MAKTKEDARERLDDEYGQIRRHIDSIHDAMDQVVSANAEDDIEGRLKELEDVVKKVRTGGVLGHGANGHARARKEYLEFGED